MVRVSGLTWTAEYYWPAEVKLSIPTEAKQILESEKERRLEK
jgi:hypothetical protein